MKYLNLISIFSLMLLLILAIGCEKNEIQPDETLENIVGTWYSTYNSESRTFTSNFEFIDSLFSNYREPNQTLDCIIKGKYKIINGFIEFSDINYTYVSGSGGYTYGFQFTTWKFEIIDNTLFLNEKGIFKPVDHEASEINGKWQSNRIGATYYPDESPKSLSINQIITISFNESTSSYEFEYTDTDINSTRTYSDVPFIYQYENGCFYCQNLSTPFAILDTGFIIFSDENARRVYTKNR